MKNYFWIIAIFLLTLTSATAVSSDGLREYYSFDNGITSTITGSEGTILTSVGSSLGQTETGKYKYALNLLTNESYVSSNNSYDANKNITINMWIKFNSLRASYPFTFADAQSVSSADNYFMTTFSNNTQTLAFSKYYNPTSEASSGHYAYNDSNFHMYSFVWINGTNITYYIDGVYNDTITDLTIERFPLNMDYFILGRINTVNVISNYTIDEVTIFDRALNSTEISEMFTAVPFLYATGSYGSDFYVEIDDTNTLQLSDYEWYVYPYSDIIGTPYQSKVTYKLVVGNDTSTHYGYYAVTCNYSETPNKIIQFNTTNATAEGMTNACSQDNFVSTVNTIYGLQQVMYINSTCNNSKTTIPLSNTSVFNDKYIYHTHFFTDDGTYTFSVTGSAGNIIKVIVDYNSTAEEICYYNNLQTEINEIYCFQYNHTIDGELFEELRWNYNTNTYTLDTGIYPWCSPDGYACSTPNGQAHSVGFGLSNYYVQATSFNIESDVASWIDNIGIETLTPLPEYEYYNYTMVIGECFYGDATSGSSQIRIYYQELNTTSYADYWAGIFYFRTAQQETIDAGLDATNSTAVLSDFLDADKLQPMARFMIILLTMFLIIGGFTVVGFKIDMAKGSFVVGVVLSIFALIGFTIGGWIPSWILIVLIIVAFASMLLVNRVSSNGGTG